MGQVYFHHNHNSFLKTKESYLPWPIQNKSYKQEPYVVCQWVLLMDPSTLTFFMYKNFSNEIKVRPTYHNTPLAILSGKSIKLLLHGNTAVEMQQDYVPCIPKQACLKDQIP